MKTLTQILCLLASAAVAHSAVVEFDLSPPGAGASPGLSPANVVPAVNFSSFGGEVDPGISFDTSTRTLSLALGYGWQAGYEDLSSFAYGVDLRGPAGLTENAPVLVDLTPLNLPFDEMFLGGLVVGDVILTEEQTTALLAGACYVNIRSALHPDGELRGQLIPLVENAPPTLSCPEPVVVEGTNSIGEPVAVSVTVQDPDGDTLTVFWGVNGTVYQTNVITAPAPGGATTSFTAVFPRGTNEVVVSVSDGKAPPVSCTTTITVLAKEAAASPKIKCIIPTPPILIKPNHRMVPVRIHVLAKSPNGPTRSQILSVTSSEPVTGLGSDDASPDWIITGPLTLKLRAECAREGRGRIYTIVVACTDEAGQTTQGTTHVFVPQLHGCK